MMSERNCGVCAVAQHAAAHVIHDDRFPGVSDTILNCGRWVFHDCSAALRDNDSLPSQYVNIVLGMAGALRLFVRMLLAHVLRCVKNDRYHSPAQRQLATITKAANMKKKNGVPSTLA